MNKINLIIGGIIAVLLIGTGVFGGWQLRKVLHPDPIITHDTITVVDSHWHHVADSLAGLPAKEVWKWQPRDTIRIPGQIIVIPVDSASIRIALEDYLATYSFGHEFVTDSLDANVGVIVNRNRPISYTLDYKFKMPFTTINNSEDNSITYSSYLQAGINMPLQKDNFKNFNVEATMSFPKWYGGAGYSPYLNTFSVRGGVTVIKFKKKR